MVVQVKKSTTLKKYYQNFLKIQRTYLLGEKDSQRLKGKYFKPIKQEIPYKEGGFVLALHRIQSER